MSRYSRLPEERLRHPSPNRENVGGGHGEDLCCNGTGHAEGTEDVPPQHRRGTSASDINLKRLGVEKKSRNDDSSMPEPPEDMDEAQRRTWQAQWAEALKKVQSLRLSGAQSERWSGVATDLYRPKSQVPARTSHASSLDRWNYYPGPSVNRDTLPQSDPEDAWNTSNREGNKPGTVTGSLLKGRGSKSITSFGNLEATQSIISDGYTVAEPQGRFVDQLKERPESYSALASRVQRTQSHRYGRIWGQKSSESNSSAAVPNPVLKKAISMREGGAHQDAVLEMARAYTDTVCGVPKTLECASCGRNLGIIVQGNPGVDIAFCQACRPSPQQWKKPGSRKKKNVIVQFCRKMLRLDHYKKTSS